jgi:hypothetical protein
VRYCYLGSHAAAGRYRLDFRGMGIKVTAREFADLGQYQPAFRGRLRQWGLDSPEPLATVILARDSDELARVVAGQPGTDFLLPRRLAFEAPSHSAVTEGARVLLLSKQTHEEPPSPRPCAL